MTDAPQENSSRIRSQKKLEEKITKLEERIAYLEEILNIKKRMV